MWPLFQQPNKQSFKDGRPAYTNVSQQMTMKLPSLGHKNTTYGFISQTIGPITIKISKKIY